MYEKNMFIINILILVLVGYLLVTLVLYFFQRNLLYYPAVNDYFGEKLNVQVEKVKIKTEDNIELIAWHHNKNAEKYKTILFVGRLEEYKGILNFLDTSLFVISFNVLICFFFYFPFPSELLILLFKLPPNKEI